jgi:hypothetical protein
VLIGATFIPSLLVLWVAAPQLTIEFGLADPPWVTHARRVWAASRFGGIVKIIPIHRVTGNCRQLAACRCSFHHSDILSNTPLQLCQSEAEVSIFQNLNE